MKIVLQLENNHGYYTAIFSTENTYMNGLAYDICGNLVFYIFPVVNKNIINENQ
jgi:hypothetical protein